MICGFCQHCNRLIELTRGGVLIEHFRYTRRPRFGEDELVSVKCLWSGRDPAPLPVEGQYEDQ